MERSSHHYQILEKLGEGAHGEVYRGFRTISGASIRQVVAIKILFSENSLSLWGAEFEALLKVHSPYCIRPLALEFLQGRPALILEYVDGLTLAELGLAGALDPEIIHEILAQIECGLVDLAHHQLFHGDLSPKNIMIDRSGQIRLLDFGQAHEANDQFTLDFVAPERLMGARPCLQTDLYSLGAIAQWLGAHPCEFESYKSMNPADRALRQANFAVGQRECLAELVTRHLRGKKRNQETLKSSPEWPKGNALASSLWRIPRTVVLMFMLLSLTQAESSDRSVDFALLQLRTHKWHFFYLNGKPLGYSPLDVPVRPGRQYFLKFVNSKNSGQLTVRLKANEVETLSDSDLLH